MDGQNNECVYYNDRAAMNCNMDFVASLDSCAAYKSLISETSGGAEVPCSVGLSNPAYVKDELEKILKYLEDGHVTKNQHRLGCLGSSEIASAVEKIKSLIKKG